MKKIKQMDQLQMEFLMKWMSFLLFLNKKLKDWYKDTLQFKLILKYSNQIIVCKNPEN